MFWSHDGRAQHALLAPLSLALLLASAASLSVGCAETTGEAAEDGHEHPQVVGLLDAAVPMIPARDGGAPDAATAPCPAGAQVDFSLVGWATQAGGTTGGKGGRTVTIQTGAALVQALKDKRKDPAPLTLLIAGTITPANAAVPKIEVKEVQNVSLIGLGAGATFDGIGIKVVKSRNVVLRNLRVQRVLTGEKDAISIEGPVDHVWVDHCDLSAQLEGVGKDDYDGLLDTKAEAAYLTYSWNHLHDSWKASLVGSSESDTFDRKLTLHHNYFQNVNSRLPLFRGGTGHLFNNFYEDVVDTAINTRAGACLRVEANRFERVQNPWISAFSDVIGAAELRCNAVGEGSRFSHDEERRVPGVCSAEVPYDYAGVLNGTAPLAEIVRAHAGVGKLADPTAF